MLRVSAERGDEREGKAGEVRGAVLDDAAQVIRHGQDHVLEDAVC